METCTAAQDQEAGSNVREEASAILSKQQRPAAQTLHAARCTLLAALYPHSSLGNEGLRPLSDLGCVMSQSSAAK